VEKANNNQQTGRMSYAEFDTMVVADDALDHSLTHLQRVGGESELNYQHATFYRRVGCINNYCGNPENAMTHIQQRLHLVEQD
jgi:hypothetical protein